VPFSVPGRFPSGSGDANADGNGATRVTTRAYNA
jgi:hypothetical protein